jgi:hypothetical protein
MNLTTTAILLMSLFTWNSTQPESGRDSNQILPLPIASAMPEFPVIYTADDSDDDCDIVDVA